jgi:hypothetical protein
MKNMREDFHAVLNKLNRITVKCGLIVEMDRIRSVGGRSPEETAEAHKKALEVLAGAERDALEAGQIIEKLKKEIYRELGIKP